MKMVEDKEPNRYSLLEEYALGCRKRSDSQKRKKDLSVLLNQPQLAKLTKRHHSRAADSTPRKMLLNETKSKT